MSLASADVMSVGKAVTGGMCMDRKYFIYASPRFRSKKKLSALPCNKAIPEVKQKLAFL
jgi:hypothetical protein